MEGLRHRPHRLLLDQDPTSNGTRTRGSAGAYNSEANFDTNMVIILAALLCALICALGLNSIVRCALRCSRRLSPDRADSAARAAARGVKKSALRRIPVAVYGSDAGIPATDCPICLGDFADGEKVRVLPRCRHGFHVGCIDTWLLSHSSCPNCRQSLLEPPAAAPPLEAAEEGSAGDGVRGQVGRGGGGQHGGEVATGIDEVG